SAGLAFKVVENLAPAGVTQYHLGVDIGNFTFGGLSFDSRINVGVFNSSASSATANIEVRCSDSGMPTGSDTTLLTTQMIVVPNSLAQRTVLASSRATA